MKLRGVALLVSGMGGHIRAVVVAASVAVLLGCSSTPVVLAPVGPNPYRPVDTTVPGQLEVFSAVEECRDGNEYDPSPAWYQHTDYNICDLDGKRLKHVFNSVGHYDEAPRVVTLPAGRYLVKAQAQGYLQIEVPVTIESGRVTRVHLDANWEPPSGAFKTGLVSTPNGYPVGWVPHSPRPTEIN